MEYIIILFLLIIIIWIFLLFKFRKTGKISEDRKKFFRKKIRLISSPANSYKEQIMDFDKLYHHVLKEMGYDWTFWEILKKKPKEISDLNLIWKLHKLRNKLAHDFDAVDEKMLQKSAKEFKREIGNLL